VGTLRRECLDHVLILDERHLRTVLAKFPQHCDGHRPHQSLRQELPLQPGRAVDLTARIERRQVLSGLISEYRRAGSERATAGQRLGLSIGTAQDLYGARWPEGAQVPVGWIVDSGSGRLKRAGQLSEVTDHYL
jgi:hypothetical protein